MKKLKFLKKLEIRKRLRRIRRINKITLIEIALLIAITIIFLISILFRNSFQEYIGKELTIYGKLALFLIPLVLEIIPQYIGPQLILLQARMIDIEPVLIPLIIILGATLGSVIGFELGKKFGRRLVIKMIPKKNYSQIKEKIKFYGIWFMAIAAILPLPYLPIVFGSIDITRKKFFLFGILPRTIGLIAFAIIINGFW